MANFLGFILSGLLLASVFASPVSAQRLISVSPETGSTRVAVRQPITFTFDVDMLPTSPMNGISFFVFVNGTPRLLSNSLYYQWTSPRTLTAYPQENYGGLPKNAAIYWDLNPPSFISVSRKPLQPGAQNSGHFMTAYQTLGEYRIGTASIVMEEVANYEQLAPSIPKMSSKDAYGWFASVSAAESRAVTNVSFYVSGKATPLKPSGSSPTEFSIVASTNSVSALNASFPVQYTPFWLTAPGTVWIKLMSLPATNFPAAPFFSNYSDGQAVDASQDFVIALGTGGASTNKVRIRIRDPESVGYVVETPEWSSQAPLAGDTTSFLITAGTLRSGKTYEVEISRWTGSVTSIEDEETTTLAAIGSITRTQMKTETEVTSIVLSNPSYGLGNFSVEAALSASRTYVLERSADWLTWNEVATVFVDSASHTFSDADAPSGFAIYRVREQ